MILPNTVRLHRVLAAKPEKIYRAFIEADALAKWLPPNGFTCTVHQLEAKVGGTHRMSFRNFTTGNSHSFGGEYVELVPNERLRYTDKFDDPNLNQSLVRQHPDVASGRQRRHDQFRRHFSSLSRVHRSAHRGSRGKLSWPRSARTTSEGSSSRQKASEVFRA